MTSLCLSFERLAINNTTLRYPAVKCCNFAHSAMVKPSIQNANTHRVLGVTIPEGLALQVAVLHVILRHAHCSNMASAKPTAVVPQKTAHAGRKRSPDT